MKYEKVITVDSLVEQRNLLLKAGMDKMTESLEHLNGNKSTFLLAKSLEILSKIDF